ncbi:MAG: ankyrin repeat domain-containing protein [Candidatus Wallbacteria bacterium]
MLKTKYIKLSISLFIFTALTLSFFNMSFAANDNALRLITAIEKSDFQSVKKLIADGQDVNCRDQNGVTPLMAASGIGNMALITLLVDAGADVNAADDNQTTVLMYSVLNNKDDVETFKYLLSKGSSLNSKDANGITVLEIAQNRGNNKIINEIKKNFEYVRNQIFNISFTALILLFFVKFIIYQNEQFHKFMAEKNYPKYITT